MKGKERDDSCCKKKPRDDPPGGKDSKTQAGFRLACPFYCQNRSAYAQCQKDIDPTFANVIQHILREPAAPPLPRLKRTFEGRKCTDSLNKQHEHYWQQKFTTDASMSVI
ncbi:hypothetical protein BFJ70_g16209 [Fusarium oxysporum]|uniref:Uncharacterized protein n=1 Tax=Fusarium oxysporum Fo47 TaxID=660027 RepID=W9L1Y4_FUSOX|nr:hypothetical protein FOZG_00020 [Fusarium oxysporum Fo47]RKL12514.1 hypothetical protein BFJ70_g16209 [Fusarium oxysporum]